ncbi:AAA family ATPase [Paenibacillus cymbidii]|uniref:AAA family ATPase n=1 Tax=Paenibacillus cymbidii TaxID=1639034 RepID=UPI001080E24B|nr:AAA family ATPase [Paenibacillus cymbidii]
MIIWLNGAFGAGKTTCAFELHRRLPDSFVYDPENIGYFIRRNTPRLLHEPDFQDHPLWRSFNYEMLAWLARDYPGTIIVPMTVVDRRYYDAIIARLRADGLEVKAFILYADKEVIMKRLNKRAKFGETWAKAQVDRCLEAFNTVIPDEKIVTDRKPVDSVVEEIAARSGLRLPPDNRSRLKKQTDRLLTLFRHIR